MRGGGEAGGEAEGEAEATGWGDDLGRMRVGRREDGLGEGES